MKCLKYSFNLETFMFTLQEYEKERHSSLYIIHIHFII